MIPEKRKGLLPEVLVRKLAICFCVFILFGSFQSKAQDLELAFDPGEKLSYGAYFNWHFIWVHAGEVNFLTDTLANSESTCWNIQAYGRTFKAFDILYAVRDTFESQLTTDPFSPLHFRRVVNHGKNHSRHEYWFNQSEQKIFSEVQRREDKQAFQDTLHYNGSNFDLLSTAFFFRSYSFSEMKEGEVVKFKILVDNHLEELFFTYLGVEEVKTREKERFRCHKVSVMLLEGDFFPKGEHMKIWFTDDQNKIPVIVETDITIGSVKGVLKAYKNLKYPLTSKK
jgi:hypothetical protein